MTWSRSQILEMKNDASRHHSKGLKRLCQNVTFCTCVLAQSKPFYKLTLVAFSPPHVIFVVSLNEKCHDLHIDDVVLLSFEILSSLIMVQLGYLPCFILLS